eukprot:6252264-Prymnesium_polylepis.2
MKSTAGAASANSSTIMPASQYWRQSRVPRVCQKIVGSMALRLAVACPEARVQGSARGTDEGHVEKTQRRGTRLRCRPCVCSVGAASLRDVRCGM